MFKTGLVIGKFYPPHRGHKLLIDKATAEVERLTVIVCDRQGETIPGRLRAAWLRELHPQATVLCIDDVYPDDDSALWARLTIGWLGRAPEAVFSSEDYGERYARLMGSTHVLFDRARRQVPCSGTLVRADPLAWWEYLEPCVRAYFARRICLVGAESTGKTTLAQALAAHYRTIWVPEYGREYTDVEDKIGRSAATPWRSEEFVHIAREQSRREDMAAREANRLLICDTDAFATGIWHERYLGTGSPEVQAIAAPRRYDLYLLTAVDLPFVDDGTRDGEHIRHWMHGRFLEELGRRGQPFALVSGTGEQRLAMAIRHIDSLPTVTAATRAAEPARGTGPSQPAVGASPAGDEREGACA